jgi:hypothetical protein
MVFTADEDHLRRTMPAVSRHEAASKTQNMGWRQYPRPSFRAVRSLAVEADCVAESAAIIVSRSASAGA